MIKLQRLRIEEFRGIRELDLAIDGKSLAVFGPNGSGKSGLVDAIDFVLTGNVARLSGAGTGGISVVKHAPHVHKRNAPDAARVTLLFKHAGTGQVGTLTRSVKTPGEYKLEPDTPELVEAVDWAAQHSELTLTRREVIKYVNAEPGKRAQEVQALLKLDRIDETRRLLQAAKTKTGTTAKAVRTNADAAEDAVKRCLGLPELLASEVLAAVNDRRSILGLVDLAEITQETDLSAGAKPVGAKAPTNKTEAIRDLQAIVDYLSEHAELDDATSELSRALGELEADPRVLDDLRHRNLVEVGLPLVSEAACPLCDAPWQDTGTLQEHLRAKIARSEAAADLQRRVENACDRVVCELRRVRALLQTGQPHAGAIGHTSLQSTLVAWSNDIAAFESKLSTLESAREETLRLEEDPLATPPTMITDLAALLDSILALPDLSATDTARSFLSVAQDRWQLLRQARAAAAKAAAAQSAAEAIYETYNEVADAALTNLYTTVEGKFSSYYRKINEDDEASFKAGLEAIAGKLELEVDFYGIGMFPPTAYHSEGHQDGMGVCLYLALIGQMLKADFRYAVLDDVVTSVDIHHRRQFCQLLRDEFPDVQFIITTHDEVWARQMVSSGLIGRSSLARFYGWSVDGGPFVGQGSDLWESINADLDDDYVPGAAHKLRRTLEASLSDIAANIQGSVVYRGDNNYDLSTFFSAVKGRHGDLLKKAATAANSWNDKVAEKKVLDLKAARAEAILAQDGENWAINALVHNNDWATMSKGDFRPVVEACRQFLDLFTCSNPACDGWLYVSPLGPPGREEELRCPCSTFSLNLRKK